MTATVVRRTLGRIHALFLALALAAVTAAPARAEGENWVPLYNKLATMLDQCCQAVGSSFSKRISPCATVNGKDLDEMRHCIINLAKDYYLLDLNYDGATELRPLIEEVKDTQGNTIADENGNPTLREPNLFTLANLSNHNAFTRIPSWYGPAKYKNCFSEIYYEVDPTPVLWEHFDEIYRTLPWFKVAKYTGGWYDNGEDNTEIFGLRIETSWALASAVQVWRGRSYNNSRPPLAEFYGNIIHLSFYPLTYDYMASACRVSYYYQFAEPATELVPVSTEAFVYASEPSNGNWDSNGDPVKKNAWSAWCSELEFYTDGYASYRRTTVPLSNTLNVPNACAAPSVSQATSSGWRAADACVLMKWNFPAFSAIAPTAVPPPSAPGTDDQKDGLIQLCESCLTACPINSPTDPRDPFDGIDIKNQFGTSNATEEVKVAAYAAKLAGSQPSVSTALGSALPYGQNFVYSLDTRILSDSVVDGQRYVNLLRPRGRIVTFRFSSDTASHGSPVGVDQSQDYYLIRSNDGASYYLVFNDGGRSGLNSIHYYYQGSLSGVGVGPSPAATDTRWGTAPGPGLEPVYELIPGTSYQRMKQLATAQKYNTLLYDGTGRYTGAQAFDLDFDATGAPTPGAALAQSRYAYDADGRLTQAENSVQGALSSGVQITYTDTANKAAYAYYGAAGATAPAKVVTLTQATSTSGVRTVTTYTGDRDKDAQGAVIAAVSSVSWQTFPWGEEKVAETNYAPANPGPADTPTLYTYYTDAANDGDNYGHLKLVVNPDQSWARYTYDAQGRTLTETTPFLNAAPDAAAGACKVVAYSYTSASGSGDDGTRSLNAPRLTVTTLCGQEVARSWRVEQAGRTLSIHCAAVGAAWNAAANQATVTERFTSGDWQGRTSRVIRPDGTVTIYGYAMDNGDLVTTVSSGALAADGQSVIAGIRSVSRMDAAGRELFAGTYDIASNLLLSSNIQSAFDEFGRVTQTDYSDGTSSETVYGCCGPDTVTGRDGIVTSYVYDDLQQVVSETRAGLTTAYTRDLAGNTTSITRLGSDSSAILQNTSTYDSAGRLTASADALGNVTAYAETLNADGTRTKTTTNPDGTTQIETFNRDGSPAAVTGTAVHPLKYEYGVDTYGPYTKTIHVGANNAGTEWTKSYTDFLGRTYKTVTSGGAISQTFYNVLGQQIKAVDPDGVTSLYAYNARGEQEYAATDMNGNSQIDFAGPDRITRTQSAVLTAHSTTVRRTTASVWTAAGETGQAVQDASADGHQQWNTRFGQTTATEEVIVPATAIRTVTITRPDGTRLVSVTQNGRALSETQYDSANAVVAGQTRTYDPHGRVATETDSRGLVTSYAYDNADRITSVTRASGGLSQVTAYAYDAMGQLTETTLPDGGKLYQTYWPDSQPRRKWGAREYPSETAYDIQGRRITLTTWQDFAGSTGTAVTTWAYDPVTGLPNQKLYPDGKGPSYTYTAAGRPLTRTWARGIVTTYGYTVAGDPATIDYSNTTGTDVTYAYDRQGRQTSVTDAAGIRAITYTAAGQPDVITHTGGPLDGIALDYAQDALNRPAGYTATMGAQIVAAASHGYDAAGRLGTVTFRNDTFVYSYIQGSGSLVGGITARRNNNPVMTTTKNYDGLNRLTTISQRVGTNVVSSHAYAYNQADQRTRATREDGAYWDYSYDTLGQVVGGIKKTAAGQPIPGMAFGYSYDDIGNRKTSTTGVPAHESAYTANLLNQYTQRTVPNYFDLLGSANPAATVTVTSPADSASPAAIHAAERLGAWWHAAVPVSNSAAAVRQSLKVTGVLKGQGADGKDIVSEQTGNLFVPQTPETFTYDTDGNLLTDGRWSYSWDAENRLIAMETPSGIGVSPMTRLVFVYDAQSRRISKKVFTKPASVWVPQSETRFLYDDWNLIAEFAVDPATQTRTIKTAYVWGLDLSGSLQGAGGVGGLLASPIATGIANYFCYDGNGNVVASVAAGTGTVSAMYEYDPFGCVIEKSGAQANDFVFKFSTKYQDTESGLNYYGYRYYSADMKRWINRDGIGEFAPNIAADTITINLLYSICRNNTINYVDPLGDQIFIVKRPLTAFSSGWTDYFQSIGATGGAFGGLSGVAWGFYIGKLAKYYRDHTWHCSIVVTCSANGGLDKNGDLVDIKDIPAKDTWDFQADNQINNPARDWTSSGSNWTFPSEYYSGRKSIEVIVNNDSLDSKLLQVLQNESKDQKYVLGGSKRYNCCDWVTKVLKKVGKDYDAGNPKPFGNLEPPSWVPAGIFGHLIDQK